MVELRLLNVIMPPKKVRALSDLRRSAMSKPRFRFAQQNTSRLTADKQPQPGKLALVLNRKVTGRSLNAYSSFSVVK